MTTLTDYIDAWLAADPERIAALVAEDGVVSECYGPVYVGRAWVLRWAREWFAAGGVVHGWDVVDHIVCGDREVARWTFECTWAGERSSFDGATVARVADGLIVDLLEFLTTAEPYEWRGTWR